MDLKIWILSSIITILIGGVSYTSKLIIKYVKSELADVIKSSKEHSIALAENTEQLKSLFNLINRLTVNADDVEKRINKIEIEIGVIKQSCVIHHK